MIQSDSECGKESELILQFRLHLLISIGSAADQQSKLAKENIFIKSLKYQSNWNVIRGKTINVKAIYQLSSEQQQQQQME